MRTPFNSEELARLMQAGMQEHYRQKRVAQLLKTGQVVSGFITGMVLAYILYS